MKPLSLLVGAALLIGAAPPPSAETRSDVRCFVAIALLSETKDQATKQAAIAGALYYLGRLDGRSPGLDLEEAVAAEAGAMSAAEVASLLQSCGGTIEKRGEYMIKVGKALDERGKPKP